MIRNAVMPLKMVSHEETRDVYKYENNKKVEGSQIKKTRCLFIRTVDKGWGTLNPDGTYPNCHAVVVDLPESIFSQIDPKREYECACDITEDNFKTTISLKKIKINNSIFDIKAEDVVSVGDSVPAKE